MRNDEYYSVRSGKNRFKHSTSDLEELFLTIIKGYARKFYFQEYFGDCCSYYEFSPEILGNDEEINAKLQIKTGRKNLWPICKIFPWQDDDVPFLLEDDIFDLVEFFYDCISKPIDGNHHCQCGYSHYKSFNSKLGKKEYRKDINTLLVGYGDGYRLDDNGKIFSILNPMLMPIFQSKLLSIENKEKNRFERAKEKFLSRNQDNKRDAIKDLADILEHMHPKAEKLITKSDDSDIFKLLNRFGFRHNNKDQSDGYDKDTFYPWIFNYLLVSIISIDRIIIKNKA